MKHDAGYGERVFYVAVAVVWTYSVVRSGEPSGAPGSTASVGMHAFALPMLLVSVLLLACALTDRATQAGLVMRWLSIAVLVMAGAIAFPAAAVRVAWFFSAFFGSAAGPEPSALVVGALALLAALGVLLRSVFKARGKTTHGV